MKETLTAGIVAAVVAMIAGVGVVFMFVPKAETTSTPTHTAGALSSPDISSPYMSFGGVRQWAYTVTFAAASTTCSVQSPAATSTLVSATAQVGDANGMTFPLEIGQSTSPNATSTSLAQLGAAGTNSNLVATTSVTALTDGVVKPSSYINVKIGSSSPSSAINGTCKVVFREL